MTPVRLESAALRSRVKHSTTEPLRSHYFNEMRRENIRANNLLQFIHQVTIEFRCRKSLAQRRFKSNLEFRYQIIVSSIKFRKGFAKFMIRIALSQVRYLIVPNPDRCLSLYSYYFSMKTLDSRVEETISDWPF